MASTLPNPILLEQAIRARLIASMAHADVDVTVQGVGMGMASTAYEPKYGAQPYLIVDLPGQGEFVGTFAADGLSAVYRVSIHDHPENGGVDAAKAFQGIWGNWHPVDKQTPDYGLHMWAPTVSGLTPCDLIYRRYATPHTPDALNYQMMFEVKAYNEE